MQLIPNEELKVINDWLKDKYGMFAIDIPMWRIVWSDSQLEKRFGTFENRTKEGLFLSSFTGVKEVPKYQYIKERYILERAMDSIGNQELIGKYSYEPVWTFKSKTGEYLPPNIGACFYIIEAIHEAAAKRVGVKYRDVRENKEEAAYEKWRRHEDLKEKLFGNETPVGDALMQGSGVSINKIDNWEKK